MGIRLGPEPTAGKVRDVRLARACFQVGREGCILQFRILLWRFACAVSGLCFQAREGFTINIEEVSILWEEEDVRRTFIAFTYKLGVSDAWREDYVQELTIFIAHEEGLHRDKNWDWFKRRCWFYLQNLLRKGTSVDSPKHRNGRMSMAEPDHEAESGRVWEDLRSEDTVVSEVARREWIEWLSARLSPNELATFLRLAAEWGVMEIASERAVSDRAIRKHKSRIVGLLKAHDCGTKGT